jgi:hypothetical protein
MKRQIDHTDSYMDQLFKLIPAEITAAFIAGSTVLLTSDNPNEDFVGIAFWGVFLTVLVPFYLKMQGVSLFPQIFVSTVSFPIWAAGTQSVLVQSYFGISAKWLGLVLIGWVLITPLIAKR